jgi:hypothetical protein
MENKHDTGETVEEMPANPASPPWLQSSVLVGRVAELGSLGVAARSPPDN